MNYLEKHIIDEHKSELNTCYDDFAREIMALQNADTFTLLFATDIHYIREYAPYVPVYKKLKQMVEFSGYVGADLLAVAGDSVDGNTTLDCQYRDLLDVVSLVKNSKTTSVSFAKGNHDDCSWYAFKNGLGDRGTISAKQWYTHAVNPIRVQYPITLDNENITGGYYYTDYPHLKIRVITLNTNDVPFVPGDDGNFKDNTVVGQWCLGVGERQLKWLCETLKFSESGWSVIVIAHSHPGDRALKNRELLAEILDAFKSRKKVLQKVTSSILKQRQIMILQKILQMTF